MAASAPWLLRTWRLPDFGLEPLPGGCGLAGDEDASFLALWHGPMVSWMKAPPGHAGDAGKGSELRSASAGLPGGIDVRIARPIPAGPAIAVVGENNRVFLFWMDDASCSAAAGISELPATILATNVWPFEDCLLAATPEGSLSRITLGAEGKEMEGHIVRDGSSSKYGTASASACGIVAQNVDREQGRGAVVASAGITASGASLLRIWEVTLAKLNDSAAEHYSEITIAAERTPPAPTKGAELPADACAPLPGDTVVDLAVVGSQKTLCALFADGGVLLAARETNGAAWSVTSRLSAYRVAGLRLCASSGLDAGLLDDEVEEPKATLSAVARALHAWDDGTVSLLFPASDASSLDVVSLHGGTATLAQDEAFKVLTTSTAAGSLCRFLGCGSSGSHLTVASVHADAASGCSTGNVCGLLSRLPRSTPKEQQLPGATVQQFREILGIADVGDFVERVLKFDPFPGSGDASANADTLFACEQVRRLLDAAGSRLQHVMAASGMAPQKKAVEAKPVASGSGGGWDDFDLDDALLEAEGGDAAKAAAGDGWDMDMDLDDSLGADASGGQVPAAAATDEFSKSLLKLSGRVDLQRSRLQVFQELCTYGPEPGRWSLTWSAFREVDEKSLQRQARQMAAEQCTPVLEALLKQEQKALLPCWAEILACLPETASPGSCRRILPARPSTSVDSLIKVPDAGIDWYIERAQRIVDRTGLCASALALLRHAACTVATGKWPDDAASGEEGVALSAADLPVCSKAVLQALPKIPLLYGAFRLCAEYDAYRRALLQQVCKAKAEQIERSSGASDPLFNELISFSDFCGLTSIRRAQLVFKHSTAASVAADVRRWQLSVSVEHCLVNLTGPAAVGAGQSAFAKASSTACGDNVEEAIMQSLLACLNSSGWDPSCFQMIAEMVMASNPTLPPGERIIKSPVRLLDFIIGAVYSDDQRCHAVDIFQSVDMMYACIPKADASVAGDAKWDVLQKAADDLEKHLSCVELLQKHKIKMSLSFADLRRGCNNEPMAVRSLWNFFRVLGSRYRPAVFWRGFKDELFYIHQHAFGAVSTHSVFEMYMRCLAEQEHWEQVKAVAADWSKACSSRDVAAALISLAQELVNSSPALRHASLEKARRVLKCVPQDVDGEAAAKAQAENDFIRACEMLHDLARFQPRQGSRLVGDLLQMNPMARMAQVTSAAQRAAAGGAPEVTTAETSYAGGAASGTGANGAEGFPIDSPVQLRLQMHEPLRIVTDLLEFNPSVTLESDQLHKFLALLGIGPHSACWAQVMAMSGVAHLLNGNRGEALNVTEQLLTNSHPASWKLAMALTSEDASTGGGDKALTFDHGSALLADAAKVCPPEDLSALLACFEQGSQLPPTLFEAPSPAKAEAEKERVLKEAPRGYISDKRQTSSLGLWARGKLGLEDDADGQGDKENRWPSFASGRRNDAEWTGSEDLLKKGEKLLSVDRDAAVVWLDCLNALPEGGLPAPSSSRPQRGRRARAVRADKTDKGAGFGGLFDNFAGGGSSGSSKKPAPTPQEGGGFGGLFDNLAGSGAPPTKKSAPAASEGFGSLFDSLAGSGGRAPSPSKKPAPSASEGFGSLFDSLAGGGGAAPAPAKKPAPSASEGFGSLFDSLAGGAAPAAKKPAAATQAATDRGGFGGLFDSLAAAGSGGSPRKQPQPSAADASPFESALAGLAGEPSASAPNEGPKAAAQRPAMTAEEEEIFAALGDFDDGPKAAAQRSQGMTAEEAEIFAALGDFDDVEPERPALANAFDSLTKSSAATPPSSAPAQAPSPAPRSALDSLASAVAAPADPEPPKHSFFAFRAFSAVTAGIQTLAAAAQEATESTPERGHQVADGSPPQASERTPPESTASESGDRFQGIALRILRGQRPDEETSSLLPEAEMLVAALRALHDVCPDIDFAEDRPLRDEVQVWVDADNALPMIKAVAGVDILEREGITPSFVALQASKQCLRHLGDSGSTDCIGALVHWLRPADAAQLLEWALLGRLSAPRSKQLEVLEHMREASRALQSTGERGSSALEEILRQADALSLLQSVFHSMYGDSATFPLHIDAEEPAEVAASQWLEALAANAATAGFSETASMILEDLAITPF
eukprot:TRINITY_DN11389_c0_g1_i3.p1 TRINITY_DN11389_c0_g1~~TRINITY_DN11389_c0_g1_i3.p1  ORF type:complete len:2131 (+),score=572.69 TRINITY_DN11389_c0_g1_i3:85-6393(+)